MEIKKIIASGMAALAAGATLALSAGAVTLGDFVQVTGNTMTSPYIVIGGNAAAADTLAAADVGVALAGQATEPVTIPGTSSVSATGGALVTSDLNKTYVGQTLDTVLSSLTRIEVPDLLETLSFTDMNATTISYTQRIDLGPVSPSWGLPTGETEPELFVNLATASNPFNLTVNFIGGLDSSAVDTSYRMTLFGKEYTFGATHTNTTLEFYSATGASTVTLSGVTNEETVVIGDDSYTFKIIGWGQETVPQGVFLTVNNQAPATAEWREGNTYPLPGNAAMKVYVNDVSIMSMGAQEKTVSVQLFVGTDKLKFQNEQAVTKNDVTSLNTIAFIESAVQPTINSMTLQIFPQEDTVLKEGTSFADPVFGAVKMTMQGMTPGLTSSTRDLVTLESSSTQVKLTFTNKDGNTYSGIPVAYANSTGYYRKKDATYNFMNIECNGTMNVNSLKKGDYFVVTSGDNSYVMKYDNVYVDATTASKDYVILTDLATTTQYKVYPENDKYLRIGSLAFRLNWDSATRTGKKICVDFDSSGNSDATSWTGTGTIVTIKTSSGQVITLPNSFFIATASGGYPVNVTETPLYSVAGSNNPLGQQLNVTATYDSSKGILYSVVPDPTQVGTSGGEWRYVTNFGTYIVATGDTTSKKTVNLYVPGQRPAYVNVAVGEDPVISTSATAGGEVRQAVQIKNSISKLESEVNTATLARDVVLIGGPCANGLVAEALGMASTRPDCVDDFTALYPDEGVITVVNNVFSSGQKALIVAGVDRAATRALAVKVMQGTVEYSA